MTNPKPYETKAQALFGEVCVNKALVQAAGFGTRSVPAFVSEWIVTRYTPDGVLNDEARQNIRTFLNQHLPTRDQKEHLKAQLQHGAMLTILDQFSVTVDLQRNELRLAAALFYNNQNRQPGLLTHYDLVVFDEAQSLSFNNPGEIIGVLKDYLESGSFARGGVQKVEASAGFMLLANIPLDAQKRPRHENLFRELPAFLSETAFIDRMHGILPGWELPRIEQSFIATGVGFKADFFGDVLHHLRTRAGYEQLVQQRSSITGTNDRRDLTAITRLATGYCKLLFPHGALTDEDFAAYCLTPAISLRQRIRDQLALLDPEYAEVRLGCA